MNKGLEVRVERFDSAKRDVWRTWSFRRLVSTRCSNVQRGPGA